MQYTTKSFTRAVTQVFEGIASRRDKIQDLILAALIHADSTDKNGDKTNDFGWLSLIAVQFENTAGLNIKLFASWVKAHVVTASTNEPALEWQPSKQSFKLTTAAKEQGWTVAPIMQKWFEMEKQPKMEQVYSLANSLENAIRQAEKKLKDGALSPEDRALLDGLRGLLYTKGNAQQAAADGVC